MAIEYNPTVENTKLEAALTAYIAERTPQTADAFWAAWTEAQTLLPVRFSIPPKDGVMQAGTEIGFPSYNLPDGRGACFFAFTSGEYVEKFSTEKQDMMTATHSDFLALLEKSPEVLGIVINPVGQGLIVTRDELKNQRFNVGHSQMTLPKETTITLGTPANPSEAMLGALHAACKELKPVKSATLFWAIFEGEEEGHYLLGVEFDGEREAIFPRLAEAAKPFLPGGQFIDIMPIEQLGSEARQETKPFYQKKRFRFFG